MLPPRPLGLEDFLAEGTSKLLLPLCVHIQMFSQMLFALERSTTHIAVVIPCPRVTHTMDVHRVRGVQLLFTHIAVVDLPLVLLETVSFQTSLNVEVLVADVTSKIKANIHI